jgi:hypothetical protein
MAHRGSSRERQSTLMLYPRRRGVLVTDARFDAHGRHFAVDDLANPRSCQGSMQAARTSALKLIGVETALVGATLLVATMAGGPLWLAIAIGALDLCLMGSAAWLSANRWPTPLQLWADHQGAPTMLYTSSNHTEFHKVSRALLRAVELRERLPI